MTLAELDAQVLLAINQGWANPLGDTIATHARNPYLWAPLYGGLAAWFYAKSQSKFSWVYLLIGFLATFALSDALAAQLFKPLFHRIRPCNGMLAASLRHVVPCGGAYSFVSNHASNHFALATYVIGTQKPGGMFAFLLLAWAATIAISQVYVGVHFPTDVLGGAGLGSAVGLGMGAAANRILSARKWQ